MRMIFLKKDSVLMEKKVRTNNLIVLVGPTGVGKTDLSIRLAQLLHTDIISADSRQIYRDLKIGSAAPTSQQLLAVRHYFIGDLGLSDYYSAARYEEEAIKLLNKLFVTKDNIILTGGSMMYIDAICNGIDNIPTIPQDIREMIQRRFKEEGLTSLRAELKMRDPEYYRQVDLKNHKRIIHALEICYTTGLTYSELRTHPKKQRSFHVIKIGLKRNREELYQRINQRVDEMIENGLIEEARKLFPYRQENSLNTVGYKELFQYFSGDCSLSFAIDKIKRNTRVYSRKQMTWFKRDENIQWFYPDQEKEILLCLKKYISSIII